MKKYFFVVTLCVFILNINAQMKQGTILYERKMDVHRRMKDEQMKAMVPQFRTTQHELFFNEKESVYKTLEDEDAAPDPFDNGSGGRVVIKINGPGDNSVMYKNFATHVFLEQTALDDNEYVIEDSIHNLQWKLSDETKTILNHVCKKATAKTEHGSDVIAWYADDILVPAAPETFDGLPGAVLMLDINDAEMVYTATSIKEDVDSKQLKTPTEGKHITRADFKKKMEELFGPPSADGKTIINVN